MADNIVSINNLKEEILEFTLSITGVDTKDMTTCLVIEANGMKLSFQAVKGEGDLWAVKLPALPILERTAYPYHLEIVAEGYHFEPMKGTLNVVGSHEVYVTTPKNSKFTPPVSTEVKPAIKKESTAPVVYKTEPTKQREKPVEQVARELMEANAKKTIIPPKKVEATPAVIVETVKTNLLPVIPKTEPTVVPSKDQAVRDILEGAGMKSKAKKKSRFSIKN